MDLALEESSTDRDTVKEIEAIKFLIDKDQSYYFDGKKLDYIKNIFGSGQFKLVDAT